MAKVEDKNGFWFIEHNPITRTGVYDYLGKQISPECEPNKIYKVLRPKEELFKKETLDSLRLIPIVNDHTMIGTGFTAPEDKGIDGTLGDNVSHDTDTIYNDLKIMSNKMKEDIRNGKKELSLGYFCTYDKQAGTYKGQRYDYIQRNIKANHLALVDKGRMGADVRVYDSKTFAMDSIDINIESAYDETDFAEDKDKVKEWFTSRGNHIPILEGQTKEQAFKAFIEKRQKEKEENPELNLNDDPVLNEKPKKEEKQRDLYTKKEDIYKTLSTKPYNRGRSYQWYERKNYEKADIKIGSKKENMTVLHSGDHVSFFPEVTVNGTKHTDISFGLNSQNLTKIGFIVGGYGHLYTIKFDDGEEINNGHIDTADKKTLKKWGISDEMIDGFREHILSRYPTLEENEKEKIVASLRAIDEKKSAIYEKANRKKEKRKEIFEAKKKLNDITSEYKQKLEDIILEGKRKGIVTRYKGLEITKNGDFNEDIEVAREYRHPDEYSDNGIDYEDRYQKWQGKLYDIRDKYKDKYLKTKEKVDNHPVAKKFNRRFEEYKNNKDYTMKSYGWPSGTEHQFQDKKGNGVISFYPDTFTIKKKIKDSGGDFWVEDSLDDIEEYQTTGGDMALAENRSGYEKSEPEQTGKNKATDSMEYKTIQGEGKMADKKEKVAIDEDKRKIIDEIGGILKDAGLDDELIRTVIGKAEKIAYNKSEAGDDGEEVEEEVVNEKVEEEGKDKKSAKDKCGKDEEKDKEEEEKKKVVKAFAQKEKLGKEVEDALGTFDHSEMTELEIAKYACDKLDLEVEKGQEISAVKGYLKGLAKAPKVAFGYKTVAADSGIQKEDAEFEKFSKGE